MQNPGVGSNSGSVQPVSTKTPLVALAPATATIGVSSSQIVASNASRKGLTIVNITGNAVSLAFGANPAVLNSGDTLTTIGSTYNSSEYDFVTSAVNAISSLAGTIVSIQEFI